MNKIIDFIKLIGGYCDCPCHKPKWFIYPKKRRKNTAYTDEKSNYIRCCKEYYDEIYSYYEERWEEYYRSRF